MTDSRTTPTAPAPSPGSAAPPRPLGAAPVGAVLWDLDGTLVDTEELHYRVIADWCAAHGRVLTPEDNQALLGRTMPAKWELLAAWLPGPADPADFYGDCAREYLAGLRPEMVRPDTVGVVRALARAGMTQGCVSNGDPEVIRANLALAGLDGVMAFLVSGRYVARGKPAPDPYRLAARLAGYRPGRCLAVEDSAVGLGAARAAGCVTCHWPPAGGAAPLEADYRVGHPGEFPWALFPGIRP